MMKLIEESYASAGKYRPKKINRSKHVSLCEHGVVKLQVDNVPARNCRTNGVQIPSKLFVMVKYVERGNTIISPCAKHGRHYRKACCWSGSIENLEEANAIL